MVIAGGMMFGGSATNEASFHALNIYKILKRRRWKDIEQRIVALFVLHLRSCKAVRFKELGSSSCTIPMQLADYGKNSSLSAKKFRGS